MTALILLLCIAGAFTVGCWRFTKMARFHAVAWWLDAFAVAFVVPDLTVAIATSMTDPLWFGAVVGVDVLGGFTAWHEIGTGEHHHPVRTHLLCIAGGIAAAATVVDWPRIKHQLMHLPANVLSQLAHRSAIARHAATSHAMTVQQAHHILGELAIFVAVAAVIIWQVQRRRVRSAQAYIRDREALQKAQEDGDDGKVRKLRSAGERKAIAASVTSAHNPKPLAEIKGLGSLSNAGRRAWKKAGGGRPDADYQRVGRGQQLPVPPGLGAPQGGALGGGRGPR